MIFGYILLLFPFPHLFLFTVRILLCPTHIPFPAPCLGGIGGLFFFIEPGIFLPSRPSEYCHILGTWQGQDFLIQSFVGRRSVLVFSFDGYNHGQPHFPQEWEVFPAWKVWPRGWWVATWHFMNMGQEKQALFRICLRSLSLQQSVYIREWLKKRPGQNQKIEGERKFQAEECELSPGVIW